MSRKIGKILKKNFALLLKSKMTSIVIFLGPLLIILLVGMAFNNNTFSQLNVGVYTPEYTDLSVSFIDTMKADGFRIANFTSQDDCIQAIQQGSLHTCVVFPEDFQVQENESQEIIMYADYSKTNLVAIVRESMNKNIANRSEELSSELTGTIVTSLQFARQENDRILAEIVRTKTGIDGIKGRVDAIKNDLLDLDLESVEVDTEGLGTEMTELQTTVDSLENAADNLVKTSRDLIADVESDSGYGSGNISGIISAFDNDVDDYNDTISDKYNETSVKLDEITILVNNATAQVTEIESKLEGAKTFKSGSIASFNTINAELDGIKNDLDGIKSIVEGVNSRIDNIAVTSVSSIVNPIVTRTEPVTAPQSNITYMFPFLLILVIMFVSLLLASNMIIMEKTSKAYFRNFTVPTNDIVFVVATYLTNLFVVLIQLGLLLGVAYIFLQTQLFVDVPLVLAVILIAITMFTVIGMGIGYWFNTQEGAIMVSMAVGSVFLFVSNLILPLESMPLTVQELAKYNPFVMFSELMRKIILFNTKIQNLYVEILILLGASIIIFLFILLIQKLTKVKYFTKKLPHTTKAEKKGKKTKGEVKTFKMYEKTIESKADLLEELKKMDDKTFSQYVNEDKNDFLNWAKFVLKDKQLSQKLRVKTRQEMIDNLQRSD